ncbi:MAG: glycosyltransferase [Acidimicrobiales bacterium]
MAEYPASGGVGKVWRNSLRALRALGAEVTLGEPASLVRRPDVWMFDGHLGPLPVSEPTVALLQEAPWSDPELRTMLSAGWVDRFGPPSRAAARSAVRVITPSDSSARQVARHADIPFERIVTVPYGVDGHMFSSRHRGRGLRLARRLGCPWPYVLYVSTLHPRKNLLSLQQALALLAAEGYPHGLLMVVSASPDADAHGGAHLTNPVPGLDQRVVGVTGLAERDVAALMSAAAAFCQPSLMEGFGLSVLEALSAGAPTVVSDRGSLPEVVGDAAIVVPPDPESLASGLRRVFDDRALAECLVAAGRARALQRSWSQSAGGWLAALGAAAGRS